MKLDNVFTVGVPVSQAWDVLTDLELIAPCMPGAALTGVNDGIYTGKVKIKVGPITAEYAGTAQFTEKDEATHRAVIDARGRDSRGNGNAMAVISAELQADGDSTVVIVTTDLSIAGRIAQFGSGMIKEVSAKLLGQFVTCLEGKLGADLPGVVAAGDQASPGEATSVSVVIPAGPPVLAESADPVESPVLTESPVTVESPAAADSSAPAGLTVLAAEAIEPAPIDLVSVAGGAITKRLMPAMMGLVVVAVVIYLVVRW